MQKGTYRIYFNIGKLGIKLARFNFMNGNAFCSFLTGIIMNLLEYKRYNYYCKNKGVYQWGRKWYYSNNSPVIFSPCYFTCGFFNIVKHLPNACTEKDIENIDLLQQKTYYLCQDMKTENFKKDKDNKIYCIDYAYFKVNGFTSSTICNIDYK